jgi:hypothetical protein
MMCHSKQSDEFHRPAWLDCLDALELSRTAAPSSVEGALLTMPFATASSSFSSLPRASIHWSILPSIGEPY